MQTASTRRGLLLAALAVLAVLSGCGPDGGDAVPAAGGTDPTTTTAPARPGGSDEVRDLWLPFSEVGDGVEESALSNNGTAPAVVSILSADGGRLARVSGPAGAGSAIEFPRYDGVEPAPRAVLHIAPAGVDDLAPGDNEFEFGADFRVNKRAQGEPKLDNGNNLVQRGLAGDSSQLKIEVDKGRPACRIRGVEGQVDVKLEAVVEPDVWYRILCGRRGNTVSVALERLTDGEPVVVESRQSSGSIGALVFLPSLPLSVGGKLSSSGHLVTSATDQFNGAVDNVVFNAG